MKTIIRKCMKILMTALLLLIPLGMNGNTVYAEDSTVISDIEFNIDYPTHGTIVEAEKYEDGTYKWDTQTVSPKVTIPEGKTTYELDEREDDTKGAYWLDKNKEFFVGEFKVGEEYYARVWIRATDNNQFNSNKEEITVKVNNVTIDADDFYLTYGSQNVYLCVTFKMKCQPKIIDKVKFDIAPPIAGETVSGDWGSQTPAPEVSIPDNSPFKVISKTYVTGPKIEDEPLEETFVEGQYYYVSVRIENNEGFEFPTNKKDLSVNVTNGEFVEWIEYNEYEQIAVIKVQCVEQHKVTFDANGGTIDGASKKEIPVVDGKVFDWDELPEPTRAGKYIFYGWYTDKQCTKEFEYWKTPIKSNITLYAKWVDCSIVDLNGGSIWEETVLRMPLNKGHQEIIPTEEELTNWGFVFPDKMRYVGIEIEGRQYKPGDVYTVKQNVMATVIYVPYDKYVLTFDLDGGRLGDQVGVAFLPYDLGQDIKLPKPTKNGNTFEYWEDAPIIPIVVSSIPSYYPAVNKYFAGDPYKVDGDKTFKAVWKPSSSTPKYTPPNTGVE